MPCTSVGYCLAPQLQWLVLDAHDALARTLRHLILHLSLGRASAPQQLITNLISVWLRVLRYEITRECGDLANLLYSVGDTPACRPIEGQMKKCLLSLAHEMPSLTTEVHATQCASSVWPSLPRDSWKFNARSIARYAGRDLVLGDLLQGLLDAKLAEHRLSASIETLPECGGLACSELGILHIAELGVREAATSEALLEEFPSLRMLLVDPYEGEERATLNTAMDRLKPFGSRATFVVQRSQLAARYVGVGSLDLVFVDGDHSYDAVKGDIRHWFPTIRLGGVLAGHDYCACHLGLVAAVHEFVTEHKLFLHLGVDTMWWVFVPKSAAS